MKIKNLFFGMLAFAGMLAVASCSQDDFVGGETAGDYVDATFTVSTADGISTRATIGKGTKANKVACAIYDKDGEELKNLYKIVDVNADKTATYQVRLAKGQAYKAVFFAYNNNGNYYNVEDLTDIKVLGNQNSNVEERDAFTGTYDVTAEATMNTINTQPIELKRPLAQLNLGIDATELADAANAGIVIKNSYIKVSNVYSAFNAYENTVVGNATEVVFAMNAIPDEMLEVELNGQPDIQEDEKFTYLAMNYLLVGDEGSEKTLTDVEFVWEAEDGNTNSPSTIFPNVRTQRNFRTNIIGKLITNPATFNVKIDENFAGDDNMHNEGYFVNPDNNSALVQSADGLVTIANAIAEGTLPSDIEIVLDGEIDLAQLAALTRAGVANNWNPIGTSENPFTGTFDGKGYTIKNLALVETEAKEGKAYIGFFGYAENATIKNVTFENVYINIPCLDINHSQGHIGAVVGSLEGTSTIENVTVKGNIFVEATPTANGASRVAVVAGGNTYGDVTIKNVHVIANEGSYLKANNNTGAIAGQLQGKTLYENCSSNIDVTVNKFFAGGIVGLAGTNDTFINCHTTGNIAVVAGREGRANDHYRVGGIAGGWADGVKNVLTLENCSYTGKVSGKNADGSVAEVLDYAGYVGRGYTLTNCAGSKVVVNGTTYIQKSDNVYGVYVNENGYEYVDDGLLKNEKEYIVMNANGLVALANNGLKAGETVKLGANIDLKGVEFNGLDTFHPENNNTFDGNNYTVSNWTNNSGASDMGFIRNWVGTVKNVKFENCHLKTAGRSAIVAAKVYGNIEGVTVNNCSVEDSYWACGIVAGLYNAGNISNCTVTNSSVKSNGGTGAIVGVINESTGTRKVENCKVESCTVNNTGTYGEAYSGALICGMINISNSTVEFNECTYENNTKNGKYVGDLYYSADEDVTVMINGKTVVMVSTAEELNNLKATNAYVMLAADIDFQGAAMTKPIELWKDCVFDGMGHKISNVTTAVQGGYATSLFRGDANPGNKVIKNLVIENLTTPAGYSYAATIWSDLQGANIEIDNVEINNATIAANGTIGGFVGFVSASTTSVVVKNSSINNSNLNGGEADHKRGAVVGRAYGCAATCENVVVNNVKINDVAATTSTLVGDKGYTGTVTVK